MFDCICGEGMALLMIPASTKFCLFESIVTVLDLFYGYNGVYFCTEAMGLLALQIFLPRLPTCPDANRRFDVNAYLVPAIAKSV